MTETTTKSAAPRKCKMAQEAQGEGPSNRAKLPHSAEADKPKSKTGTVLAMLQRPEGATLDELVAATGWLPHTTRAALTGLRKKGHTLTSDKQDGVRRYRIHAAPEAGAAR